MRKSRDHAVLDVTGGVLAVVIVSVMFKWPPGWWLVVGVPICVWAAHLAMKRRDAFFARRMSAPNAPTFRVFIGGQDVGVLTDAEYAEYEQAAFRDNANAIDQIENVLRVAFRLFGQLVSAVPIVLFWLMLATVFIEPDLYVTLITGLKAIDWSDPAAVARLIAAIAPTVVLMMILAIVVLMLVYSSLPSNSFSIHDSYRADVARMVRARFNVPMHGDYVDVHLTPTATPMTTQQGEVKQ